MHKAFRILFFITLVAIEFLATTTSVHIEIVENIWDKANHFAAFLVLYVLFSLAYSELSFKSKSLLLLLFGLQIEIVQSFIPGRYFSLLDVVADMIGIVLGIVLYRYLLLYKIYKLN